MYLALPEPAHGCAVAGAMACVRGPASFVSVFIEAARMAAR